MKYVRKQAAFEGQEPYLVCALVEDALVEGWLTLLAHEHGEAVRAQMQVEPVDRCTLDGGGMVMQGEPVVRVDIDGCAYEIFLRQVEFMVPRLREASPRSAEFLGDHVWVRMKWNTLVLTRATAAKVADALAAQAVTRTAEADAAWAEIEGVSVSLADAQAGAPVKGKAIAPTRAEQRRRAGLDAPDA